MKLLLDENLSRRIVPFLQPAFPGSTQVTLIGLDRADDAHIWHYAQENGFVHRKEIEQALIEQNLACIEIGSSAPHP